jgi:hypothetical protein
MGCHTSPSREIIEMPLQPFNIWFARQQGHEVHKGCLFAGAIPHVEGPS